MTVRSVQPTYNKYNNYTIVKWAGLLNGDTGEAFDCAGMFMEAQQVVGTAGAGFDMDLEFSLEDTPTNWVAVTNVAFAAAGFANFNNSSRWIRPNVTAGDGTTSVDLYIIFRT